MSVGRALVRHALVESRYFLGLYQRRVSDWQAVRAHFRARIAFRHLEPCVSNLSDVFFLLKLLRNIYLPGASILPQPFRRYGVNPWISQRFWQDHGKLRQRVMNPFALRGIPPYPLSERTSVSNDGDRIKAPVVVLAPERSLADGVGFSDQGELLISLRWICHWWCQ